MCVSTRTFLGFDWSGKRVGYGRHAVIRMEVVSQCGTATRRQITYDVDWYVGLIMDDAGLYIRDPDWEGPLKDPGRSGSGRSSCDDTVRDDIVAIVFNESSSVRETDMNPGRSPG